MIFELEIHEISYIDRFYNNRIGTYLFIRIVTYIKELSNNKGI